MSITKTVKTILLILVYWINLVLAFLLWLCGQNGNIMLGIILIVLYRPSLWFTPAVVTAICWLPIPSSVPIKKRVLFYVANLLICASLFVICRLLFGNWF